MVLIIQKPGESSIARCAAGRIPRMSKGLYCPDHGRNLGNNKSGSHLKPLLAQSGGQPAYLTPDQAFSGSGFKGFMATITR